MAWSLMYDRYADDLAEQKDYDISFDEGEIACIVITFAASGTAEFFSSSDGDPLAYLCDEPDMNLSTGVPYSYLTSGDDDDGSNFNFTYDVKAGTTYYLYVRFYRDDFSGSIPFTIVPPVLEEATEWDVYNYRVGEVTSAYSDTRDYSPGEVTRYRFTFPTSGTATVYTSGSVDTYGYLGTSTSYDTTNGRPDSYLDRNDDSGDGRNFSITFEAEADTNYYVWVRGYDLATYGEITFHIEPPGSGEYYQPSYDDTKASITTSGASITIEVTGLDPDYDDVWFVFYSVVDASTDETIVELELYSDRDLSYDKITLTESDGIKADTTYRVYVTVLPYPYIEDNAGCTGWWNGIFGEEITTGSGGGSRPAKFAWTYPKVKGQPFNVTAAEWRALLDNINAVLVYKGENEVAEGTLVTQFTYPYRGDTFIAMNYNQALYQGYMLDVLTWTEYTNRRVSSGDTITAFGLNDLVDMINSIE